MEKIAVLGPQGTFTDEAAHKYFGEGKVGYAPTITHVFEEVNSGKADYGVVPIENSTEGSVAETIDCLMRYDLYIWGEIYHKIQHVLAGLGTLKDVKKIRSHPQAIAQCMGKLKLDGKFPKIITKMTSGEDYSTAGAMASVAKSKDKSIGAIGSMESAKKYKLNILIDNLADMEDNETRFFIISKKQSKSTGSDKTSIFAAVKDESGALYTLLEAFSKENLSLTKIESRPSRKKKWTYMFSIDFEGHVDEKSVQKVLAHVEKHSTFYKLLGSYPKG